MLSLPFCVVILSKRKNDFKHIFRYTEKYFHKYSLILLCTSPIFAVFSANSVLFGVFVADVFVFAIIYVCKTEMFTF